MNPLLIWSLFILGAYFVGAIPFGYLLGRAKGVDIRQHGSGNIGSTNLGRLLGRKWGIGCFVLDVVKGAGPVAAYAVAGPTLGGPGVSLLAWLLVGVAAIVGHMFPVYLRFRGGKGVATGLGVVLALWPVLTAAGLIAFVLWVLVTKTSGYVSLGSIIGALSLPVSALVVGALLGTPAPAMAIYVSLSVLLALLVVVRHRGNIARLRAGTEATAKWTGK